MALDDQPINWGNFSQNYSGLRFSIRKDACKVFVPTYKNISHSAVPALSGSEMVFQDEWSNHAFLASGDVTKINTVLLEDLYEYASGNILWDDFTQKLSFQDIDVSKVDLEDFVANLDSFLIYHKLAKFGDVWWVGRVASDLRGQDTAHANVFVPNLSGFAGVGAQEQISFWSADKYLNDEFKKYSSNQVAYSGFFKSADFTNGGWFTIPDLTLSTKPFDKLKIAQILLNLNFTFDPVNSFGKYYAIDSTMASRIKDETSGAILDVSQAKTGQNKGTYTDSLINHWIGGLVSTANVQNLGKTGTFSNDTCSPPPAPLPTELSHLIEAQISLNPEYNSSQRDQLGTIDSINWRSSENTPNAHNIGVLNTDRSFGGANGTIDGGLVFGGIQTTSTGSSVLDSVEIWNGIGFLKNVQTHANNPRCFHVQGGFGGKSLAALAGYTSFNTDDYIQFGQYGKAGVRNDLEVFIKSDDAHLSYFRTVPHFALTVGRGDASGALTVSTTDRQDKFAATSALQGFSSDKNNEQTVAEFINSKSGTDNFKRYTVTTLNGFIYGGSSTGNVYMSTVANNDILNSFEKVSTVFVDVAVSDETLITPALAKPVGTCQKIIQDVVTVAGTNATGVSVMVPSCGKYRLTYLNGGAQRGAPVQHTGGRHHHGILSSISNIVSLPGLPSLADLANEIQALGPIPNPPSVPGLPHLPPLPADLFGSDATHLGSNPYSLRLRVYINEQKYQSLAFSIPDQNTIQEIQKYLQVHPSFGTFDFCVPFPNSTIKLIFDCVDPGRASGFINYQLCYLGPIDGCGCPQDVIPEITSVAVSYATVDPNLSYPVQAHGMCYVGTEKHGLSTGGRCENNVISNVEANLLNKYSTGYKVDLDLTQTVVDFQKSRVLDLVYQYDGTTWIRQQNLLESVYYHTGVGDDTRSIFWGGIHDTLSHYSFSYNDQTGAAPTPLFSDWNCSNKVIKTVTENNTNGVGYVPELNTSACWQAPNWASVAGGLLFDNPLFVNKTDADYIKYARDPNFPAVNFTSLYPADVAVLAQQTYNNINFNFTVSSLDISANLATNNQFGVRAITIGGNSTLKATWMLTDLELVFNQADTIYPANITGALTNEIKKLAITEIDANTDSVDFAYNLSHYFNYQDSTTLMTSAAGLRGVGSFSFNSLNDMWTQGVSGHVVMQTPVNTMLVVSTSSDTSAAFYINGYVNARFEMVDSQGVMIGVQTTQNTWAASMEGCGNNITSFLNINANFGNDHVERWGVPLWNSAFDRSGNLFLTYSFNERQTLSDGNFSTDDYQITSVSASAGSVAAIFNNRILIKGMTHEQLHMAQAINGATVPAVSSNCQTVIPSLVVSFTTPSSGSCYSEWASSFVQEYSNDNRFKIPQTWKYSNGFGITADNTGILFKSSSWKRYMDGVGLGGDAPDYDTIFNAITKKAYGPGLWAQIGKWHIGQMAFGTTSRSVIVGGHKISRTAGQTLTGSGLHAAPTTKRVFVWDFNTIPEEDSYLTNYLGRRFHTYYSHNSATPPISGNHTRSDLNCIIFDAASNIIVERHATAVFDGSKHEVSVTFDTALPDNVGTNYSISLTPDDNVPVWWDSKSADGFVIKVGVSNWKGHVDYLATAVIQVTEQDITNLGPLDGYIFNK